MKNLRISPDLALPPDVVTSTLVVYGGKGMGKTNLGSVLIEELTKAGLRWCLLDPMGVSWGLRHSADGKGPGVECVILGGAHGDIPIEPTGGAIVADLVIDEGVNTIIDFSRKANGQMWTAGERVRFVTDYARRLFERQGELLDGRRREPIMQLLDEAARYIPQQIPAGNLDLAKCVGAWEQICEEGRNIGLGVAFLTQRSARMNKSVSELADVMFAFRTIGPNSLDAVMDWLGEHVERARVRELSAQVRELDVGHALVVSPGWLRVEKIAHIRHRETFDSSATPKAGQSARKITGQGAKPDLARYQQRMAATIEKVKADDPKELRKEIAALKKENSQFRNSKPAIAAKPVIDQTSIDKAVERAVAAERVRARRLIDSVLRSTASAQKALDRIGPIVTSVNMALVDVHEVFGAEPAPVAVPLQPSTPRVVSPVRAPREPRAGSNGEAVEGVGKSGKRILAALAFYESVGKVRVEPSWVAAFVGMSTSGGSWGARLSELRKADLVITGGGGIELTDKGRAAADTSGNPTSLQGLHDKWRAKLGGSARRMLDVLLAAYPEAITRADLGAAVEMDIGGGSFGARLSELRAPGLLDDKAPRGELRASDVLFPEGLS